MYYLPSSRRYLFPAFILLGIVFLLRISTQHNPSGAGPLIDILLSSENQRALKVPPQYFNQTITSVQSSTKGYIAAERNHYYKHRPVSECPSENPHLTPLWTCSTRPNPYTNHIRLSSIIQNISHTPPSAAQRDSLKLFNPTIIALPYWSENPYLLVSRVVTEGFHQESILCEARICFQPSNTSRQENPGDLPCSFDDLEFLGSSGGLRCNKAPQLLRIPPTPAERCVGSWASFPDIPGFHDPRIFWSGKGEPLMIVNSASAYGCVGLWIIDLRALYKPLSDILVDDNMHVSTGEGKKGERMERPLMSYPHLTELTRNPRSDRAAVEKNWLIFYPKPDEAFVHYDMTTSHNGSGGRSFAKLIGNGFSTPNLTDTFEQPCLENSVDGRGEMGHWHQASNTLNLVLCTRDEARKIESSGREERKMVHFAIMHRKFSNSWHLPLRYERYFVVWAARPPFEMLAVSKFPLLFKNETASGWSGEENWALEREGKGGHNVSREIKGRASQTYPMMWNNTKTRARENSENWAYFTYSTSIAWAWRSKQAHIQKEGKGKSSYFQTLDVGYLDDDVLVGIGLEDKSQAFARANVRELLQCMRPCPGIAARREMPPEESSEMSGEK